MSESSNDGANSVPDENEEGSVGGVVGKRREKTNVNECVCSATRWKTSAK